MDLWLIVAVIHTDLSSSEISYIHLHSSPSTGILRAHNVTSSEFA